MSGWRDRIEDGDWPSESQAPTTGGWRSRVEEGDWAAEGPQGQRAPSDVSRWESALRGAAQGTSFGFADEATAAVGAAKDYAAGKLGLRGDIDFADAYRSYRDPIRRRDAESRDANPWTHGLSEAGGMVGSALVPGGAALAPVKGGSTVGNFARLGAGGAALGAGYSEQAPDTGEFAKDVATGAGTNMAVGAALKGAAAAVRGAGPAAARVLAHVPREDFDYYMKNAQRLKGYQPEANEAIKNRVDDAVTAVADKAKSSQQSVDDLAGRLDELYAEKQRALSGRANSLSEANELRSILEQEKQVLSEMSAKADAALDASGVTFAKDDLLAFMRKIGRAEGRELISDEAAESLMKFRGTYKRIQQAAPDQIDAKRLRTYLRQLRNDIDYSRSAGQYDERLNRMRKEFAAGISNTMKDAVPEYATYMKEMAAHASSLDDMTKYFGQPEKAIASLERVRKSKSAADQVPDAILRRHAEVTKNKDLLGKLDEWAENRRQLEAMKSGDMRQKMFPDEFNALESAKTTAGEDAARYESVKRLGPNRTQAIVENQGKAPDARIVGNIEDRRALEALGEMSDSDFITPMRDRGVVNRFYTDRTRGSRMAVMGGTLGGGLGSLTKDPYITAAMAALGSAGGGSLDKYSGHIARAGMDSAAAMAARANAAWQNGTVQEFYQVMRPIMDAARRGDARAALSLQLLRKMNPQATKTIEEPAQ